MLEWSAIVVQDKEVVPSITIILITVTRNSSLNFADLRNHPPHNNVDNQMNAEKQRSCERIMSFGPCCFTMHLVAVIQYLQPSNTLDHDKEMADGYVDGDIIMTEVFSFCPAGGSTITPKTSRLYGRFTMWKISNRYGFHHVLQVFSGLAGFILSSFTIAFMMNFGPSKWHALVQHFLLPDHVYLPFSHCGRVQLAIL
jgi:hypothetical protein